MVPWIVLYAFLHIMFFHRQVLTIRLIRWCYCRFIYLFIGVGVTLFVVSCFGCIAAVTTNGCCLSFVFLKICWFLQFILDFLPVNSKCYNYLLSFHSKHIWLLILHVVLPLLEVFFSPSCFIWSNISEGLKTMEVFYISLCSLWNLILSKKNIMSRSISSWLSSTYSHLNPLFLA